MDFPRPSSQWGTDAATNELGAWHNYVLDLIRKTVIESGYAQRFILLQHPTLRLLMEHSRHSAT